MLLEVRLKRPSKPQKWARPDDISLRSALSRELAEQQSRVDGTMALAGGTLAATMMSASSTMGKSSKVQSKPRHEQFEDSGTRLTMSAELHRRLTHPKELPRVLPKKTYGSLASSSSLLSVTASASTTGALTEATQQAGVASGTNEVVLDEDERMLQERLTITPFSRMVLVFKYDDDETLLAINAAISAVNLRALRDIQGSLRSYSLTEEELRASIEGRLDVISGFMIIDDDTRIAVLEGLAAPGKGMQAVFMDIPRVKENDAALKILANPEVIILELSSSVLLFYFIFIFSYFYS